MKLNLLDLDAIQRTVIDLVTGDYCPLHEVLVTVKAASDRRGEDATSLVRSEVLHLIELVGSMRMPGGRRSNRP